MAVCFSEPHLSATVNLVMCVWFGVAACAVCIATADLKNCFGIMLLVCRGAFMLFFQILIGEVRVGFFGGVGFSSFHLFCVVGFVFALLRLNSECALMRRIVGFSAY